MARQRLSRDDVIRGAVAYIDEHGAQSLTMRRLGASLGVEAMALYRHVAGRDALLAAVVHQVIDDLFNDSLMTEEPNSWEEYVQHVANALRNLALDHPQIFPLIAAHPPEAPWLRPPLRSLRWVDHFLRSLRDFGFSDSAAVDAYKALTSFLLGALLLQVAAVGVAVSPEEASMIEDGSLDQYPTLKGLQGKLAEDHSKREFDDGLDDLIERIRSILHP
ncbi:TetR/AcrR family transcriptional regulator [Brevibacterium marinum]|uniref:AcrR family transcriptional regulator n=1 Tax=Brevibacterium marinum TaxID=418643 RepID=A0A846RR78_9MICO|nr:TetR/AcrR family transcriptional regulator C-terminal domain-containing protein [Brevibacterium marinum]NJC56504.1 AcrR family transcriptional regulator [Brevibacterium marinum]